MQFQLLVLCKNILPSKSTFTQSLPPLHRYADISSMVDDSETRLREMHEFIIDLLLENDGTASDLVSVGFNYQDGSYLEGLFITSSALCRSLLQVC